MIYIMPVSEIEERTARLVQVKESILDSQAKLEGYAERIDELIDWAETECNTLAKHIAMHTVGKQLTLRNRLDRLKPIDK